MHTFFSRSVNLEQIWFSFQWYIQYSDNFEYKGGIQVWEEKVESIRDHMGLWSVITSIFHYMWRSLGITEI